MPFQKTCTTFTDDAGQCFIAYKRLIDLADNKT
jgi:hypothetical protein